MADSDEDLQARVCEEARSTLNQQINRLESTDSKALRIFHINVLLMGLIISFGALLISFENGNPLDFISIWTVFGFCLLFVSSVTAITSYVSSTYQVGISPKLLNEVGNGEYNSMEDLNAGLMDLYSGWLSKNANVHQLNTYFITLSVLLLLNSLFLLVLGLILAAAEGVSDWMNNFLFSISILMLLLIDIFVYKSDWLYLTIYGDD